MDDAKAPKRGAKTRSGKACQKSPMTGKRRCRAHGGATPKGRHSGPIRHGIYSKKLTEEEKALWPTIKVGSLDDEIRIAQIILHRLIETHEAIQKAPLDPKNTAGFYVSEVTVTTLDGKTVTMRVPDTYALIDRFLGRIGRLELTRARLLAAMREHGDGGEWTPLPWVNWMGSGSPPESR
jgi:hypothetical protein